MMKPVGFRYNGKKGWQIVHRCRIVKALFQDPHGLWSFIFKCFCPL